MMDYIDIVNTIRSGNKIKTTDISGIQFFMLLRDKVVKHIEVKKIGIFELNFCPIEEDEIEIEPLRLNKDNCSDFFTAGIFLSDLVKQYESTHKVLYVAIEDEAYELYIEKLESK